MKAWYMRDNHTFKELPNNADEALKLIAIEARAGFTYGTLCASNPYSPSVSLRGSADWLRFEVEARKWFADFIAQLPDQQRSS